MSPKIITISGEMGTGKTTTARLLQGHLPNTMHIEVDKIYAYVFDALCMEFIWPYWPKFELPEMMIKNRKIKDLTYNRLVKQVGAQIKNQKKYDDEDEAFLKNKSNYDYGEMFLQKIITHSETSEEAFKETSRFFHALLPIMDDVLQDMIAKSNSDFVIFEWCAAYSLPTALKADYNIALIADGEERDRRIFTRQFGAKTEGLLNVEKIKESNTQRRKHWDRLFETMPKRVSFDNIITSRDFDYFKRKIERLAQSIKLDRPINRSLPLPPQVR